MKKLFLALLVVNFLVFLWWQFDAPDDKELNVSQPFIEDSRSLVLLSEVGKTDEIIEVTPDPVVSEVKEVVIAEAPVVESVILQADNKALLVPSACYTIGPVADQNKVEGVQSELMQLGIKVNQRIVQEPVLIGYRVYIPSLPSMGGARDMLQMLKKQGIKDSVIIHKGEYTNGISLGVFSKQEGAIRHLEAMSKKGFDAKMVERYRDSEQYWFDTYGVENENRLLAEWARISEQHPEIKKQAINCK